MNQDQIEELKKTLDATIVACTDVKGLVSDYLKCESELSKKYLVAAIKKQASCIAAGFKPELFS